jgi:hypothetical protein
MRKLLTNWDNYGRIKGARGKVIHKKVNKYVKKVNE